VRKWNRFHNYTPEIPESESNMRRIEPHALPLIDAIRTISRSAHAWRDRAATRYDNSRYALASQAKKQKEACYQLKERGIAAAYLSGDLRYVGQSPQGMGVYEYGQGGRACFHSCLHPSGVERTSLLDHPETLLVAAKRLEHRICDAICTLKPLPMPGPEFERSAAPRIARAPIICYECGNEGHIARDCPERWNRYLEEEYLEEKYGGWDSPSSFASKPPADAPVQETQTYPRLDIISISTPARVVTRSGLTHIAIPDEHGGVLLCRPDLPSPTPTYPVEGWQVEPLSESDPAVMEARSKIAKCYAWRDTKHAA
jgi:hypothetical protein